MTTPVRIHVKYTILTSTFEVKTNAIVLDALIILSAEVINCLQRVYVKYFVIP